MSIRRESSCSVSTYLARKQFLYGSLSILVDFIDSGGSINLVYCAISDMWLSLRMKNSVPLQPCRPYCNAR